MRIKQIIKQAKPKLPKMFGNNTSTNNTNTLNQNTTKEIENNTSAGLNETNITKNLTGDNTPEYKEEEIEDYIKVLCNYNKELKKKKLENELNQEIDPLKQAKIIEKIMEIRSEKK